MTRGSHLNSIHQSHAGKGRASQETFPVHNKQISPDGFQAFSAYMRAPMGLRLLDPAHIQFLRPEMIGGKNGRQLSPEEQRIQFGCYVWRMVWEHIPDHAPPPTDEEYLRMMRCVQSTVGRGQPLDHALDAIYVAPNDFCNREGIPLPWKKQRKAFRAALKAACQAALQRKTRTRQLGQRRPMQNASPQFQRRRITRKDYLYGRPDLPSYAKENISPSRPYGLPVAANTRAIWFTPIEESE